MFGPRIAVQVGTDYLMHLKSQAHLMNWKKCVESSKKLPGGAITSSNKKLLVARSYQVEITFIK